MKQARESFPDLIQMCGEYAEELDHQTSFYVKTNTVLRTIYVK